MRRLTGACFVVAVLLLGIMLIFGLTGLRQTQANAQRQPSARPTAFLFNLESQPVLLTTDRGAAASSVSGHILFRATLDNNETPLELEGAMLDFDSVPTSRGETGPITLAFESGEGEARLEGRNLLLNANLQGNLTYELLDRVFGVRVIDDYTESFAEQVAGNLEFSGRFMRRTDSFSGELRIGFELSRPLLNVVTGIQPLPITISIPFAPFSPAGGNKKEVCIEIVYESEAARQQWAQDSDMDGRSDVEQMIDEANDTWCQACNIRVRTKLMGDGDCISVILRVNYAEGGGGTCSGIGQKNRSTIQIGRNVLTTCMNQGVTTTYGRILAHEIGHSLGLRQGTGSSNLMDNCAPSGTVSQADCMTACSKATPITQPAEPVRASYAFANPAPTPVNDLHIEFDRPVWVVSSGFFKDFRGEGSSKLDFGRGSVGAESGTLIRVTGDGKQPKCKSCFWTIDGRNVNRCACPKEGE